MNIKKLFALLAGVSLVAQTVVPSAGVFGADYSQELKDAYDWAYSKGVTTMSSIDNANMYGAITRAQMAKMLSVYAKEVLGNTPDTSKACEFADIDSVKGDLHDFIIESCQLGIMGQGIKNFRPYATITRAEFGTALSRVLWGDKYEGGTPYYAKHLDALKAAGIMTQIDNPESRDEVRGYVMLMLMRSDEGWAGVDCDDPVVALACLDPELDAYKECPAACRDNGEEEDNKEEEVVKSGSLVVTADPTTSRSAIKDAASDLDTLTFKTSEEVTITKVVLERYGYSSPDDIKGVWLENSDGTVVAEAKDVNSKDEVTLSIKKDYRKVDGSEDWTIVVELKANASGSTIGFKVKDVTSTAKDVDLGNYKPYTYDIVTYTAVTVSLDDKGADKDYNYEEGESYEVAKLKVKAGSSALEVNGITLTNVYTGTKKVDLKDFLDKVEVSVNGDALKGVSYTIDDEELSISFDSYEIEAKGNATFAVNITLKDFDEYGAWIEFVVKNTSDVKITEKKTWARVSVDLPQATKYPITALHTARTDAELADSWKDSHAFVGSKIKFSSKKLGSVDAAQGSDDVLVLDWEIEVAEAIDKWTFSVNVSYANLSWSAEKEPIDEMKLIVAGDEYTASKAKDSSNFKAAATDTTGANTFTFSKVEVEKSGKIQILIDVDDDAHQGATITLTPSISKNSFTGDVRYTEARSNVQQSEVKGSVSFATRVTVQPSKASLENNLSKNVEFTTKETTRKTVFDGTYTAKKGAVNLNTALITGSGIPAGSDLTFYLYIDGDEIETLDPNKEETFSNILVEAGESVKVKVEAELYSENTTSGAVAQFSLILKGDDENGNSDSGRAEENLVWFKVVEKGSFNVSDGTSRNTVLLKARNTTLASFTIKPSNNNEGLTLEDIVLTWFAGSTALNSGDIKLKIDGVEYDADTEDGTGITYVINEEIPSAGVPAEIVLKNEYNTWVKVDIAWMNGLKQTKSYSKSYADALVYIDSQQNQDSFTQYFLGVDLYDDTYYVENLAFYTNTGCTWTGLVADWVKTRPTDGDDFTINNGQSAETIRCITYKVYAGSDDTTWTVYKFNNVDYADYFKVGGTAWRVFANS